MSGVSLDVALQLVQLPLQLLVRGEGGRVLAHRVDERHRVRVVLHEATLQQKFEGYIEASG